MRRNKRNRRKNNKNEIKQFLGIIIVIVCIAISIVLKNDIPEETKENSLASTNQTSTYINMEDIPEYTDKIYVTINNNIPYFEESEYTTEPFENYSELDELGRCGVAYANICKEIMPTEERKSISDIKPTGWVQAEYDGKYLYNRCHLIGHQLAGEDANELNLITGTNYFNVSGMLQFENQVAEYINKNINNHVLYRVTPVFEGNNLLAEGVEIEAYSVEDKGQGICFNVFVYNVQPGITLDYATGKSSKNE